MAAIDKLFAHSFSEYDDFRKWAIVYYPKALLYMYRIDITAEWWEDAAEKFKENHKKIFAKEYGKISPFLSFGEAVKNIQDYYKKSVGYNCPYNQANDEALLIINSYNMNDDDRKDLFSTAIMNAPFSVDRKLKWICPIPFVRDYLHKQCGVSKKWEWLYRLFWRGKKHFGF